MEMSDKEWKLVGVMFLTNFWEMHLINKGLYTDCSVLSQI